MENITALLASPLCVIAHSKGNPFDYTRLMAARPIKPGPLLPFDPSDEGRSVSDVPSELQSLLSVQAISNVGVVRSSTGYLYIVVAYKYDVSIL